MMTDLVQQLDIFVAFKCNNYKYPRYCGIEFGDADRNLLRMQNFQEKN